jgi:glycosyltransferase involved in cell wall biosynthesis
LNERLARAPAATARPEPARPRVCYLRGSFLNPFETQYLRPLEDRYHIVVAHARSHRFDVGGIGLPRREVPCLDYLNGLVPRRIAGRPVPNVLKFLGYEEVLFGLGDLLQDFDLIHLPEQTFYFTWQAARLKPRFGCRLIVTQAEINPFWYEHRPPIVRRTELVREHADLFAARTERAAAALRIEGVSERAIRVIGHGVDIGRFHPGPRDPELARGLGIADGQLVILLVARLVWTKGLWPLADAAARLLADPLGQRLEPLFLIAGDGPDRPAFEKRLATLGIERSFRLIGRQPYDRIPAIHRLADVFVLPSISTRYVIEQFGIALIEAMASGVPVVATHCGAIDEVVGDAGRLVQANDSLRLFEALRELCADDQLRRSLGELGRQRVERNFTHAVIAAKLADAYADALGR